MKTITFQFDEDCNYCCATWEKFQASLIQDDGYYGTLKMDSNPREFAMGIIIRPDRNAHGNVTHFHLELTEVK